LTWPDFFVLCLAVGFLISVLSLFSGALHLPHFHAHLHWHGGAVVKGGAGDSLSPINAGTIAAFLIWFGGAGYLLARFAIWQLLGILVASVAFGLVGASVVFLFLSRVLLAHEKPLDPIDYELTGALGRLSTVLRQGGTGEMIFIQQGRRCGVPVRSESGASLPSGAEVVVTRYEGGIAYVRTWEEFQGM